MDDKYLIKKGNEFKSYLKKHGLNKNEIEEIFSIDELVDKLNYQFYDIDERENGENGLNGFKGICSVKEVVTRGEKYKEIVFEGNADLCTKIVNCRVVGVESTYDNSLAIFLGEDYISFAETTIKNQYYKGVYTAMREIYRYDVKDNIVDQKFNYYLYEGKTFKSPVTFFDDFNPEAYVSQMKLNDYEEINIKGDAVTSLGITYNLDTLPEVQRRMPSEVKYVVEKGDTFVYLDNVCYDANVINIDPSDIQTDFEDRYYYEEDEL